MLYAIGFDGVKQLALSVNVRLTVDVLHVRLHSGGRNKHLLRDVGD